MKRKYNVDIIFADNKHDKFLHHNDADGVYEPSEKTIYIRTSHQRPTHLLITLLHECGHAELMCKYSRKYYIYYSKSFFREDIKIKSKESKIDLIREEIAAWEQGYQIAKRLHINISWKVYSKAYRKTMIDLIQCLSVTGVW